MCGRLNCEILVALDFDDTLVHSDGTKEDFTVLSKLQKLGIELCIASRNDKYHVVNQLDQLGIKELFTFVMADFRPKSYQVKHLLWLYEKQGCKFRRVLFVDDYPPNIQRVCKDIPDVECYQFGKDIHSLTDLIDLTK